MTLPSVIRIFFAIDLPDATKEKLHDYTVALKRKAKSHAIRWAKPEQLHITLQFLAEINAQDVDKLITAVHHALQTHHEPLTITFDSLRLFPNAYRPRVIALNVAAKTNLAELAHLVGEGIRAANYAIEKKPFCGHLTLGRIKQPQHTDTHFLAEVPLPDIAAFAISEVVLFRSESDAQGSLYTVIARMPLSASIQPQNAIDSRPS